MVQARLETPQRHAEETPSTNSTSLVAQNNLLTSYTEIKPRREPSTNPENLHGASSFGLLLARV